jgi:hypothetical protein
MNRALRIAFLFIGGSAATFSIAGCKATKCPDTVGPDGGTVTHDNCVQLQPTVEYDDMTPRLSNAAWTMGTPVSISNTNGDITVLSDSTAADQVQVSAIGFTRDTGDDTGKANATAHLTKMANPTVTGDATGVTVSGPGGGVDGYKLTVHLPTGFNGAFHVTQSNGDVTLSAVPTGAGNFIHSDNGDINASLGMANVSITAKTEFGGAVTFAPNFVMPVIAMDMLSGTAKLGDGSGTLDVLTKNGSVSLH